MKKYLLPALTAVGLVALMPAKATAQEGLRIYVGPGYYESGYYPDYSNGPHEYYYYRRYYNYPPYYYYRPNYYYRSHRWHYHQH